MCIRDSVRYACFDSFYNTVYALLQPDRETMIFYTYLLFYCTHFPTSVNKMIFNIGRPLQVTVRPMLRDRCPVCNFGVLWPNGWIDQDTTWYGGRPGPKRHFVRWGTQLSPTERGTAAPNFSAHVYCVQTVAHFSNCRALVFFTCCRPSPNRIITLPRFPQKRTHK